MWSSRAEQIVSRLIAEIPPENPNRAEAARLAALPIGGSMWASYYLRPNGEVVIAGADYDHPDVDTVGSEPGEVLRVLVWGTQRIPSCCPFVRQTLRIAGAGPSRYSRKAGRSARSATAWAGVSTLD